MTYVKYVNELRVGDLVLLGEPFTCVTGMKGEYVVVTKIEPRPRNHIRVTFHPHSSFQAGRDYHSQYLVVASVCPG